MNILVVHMAELNEYPPVKTLLNILVSCGYNITLITYDTEKATEVYKCKNVEIYILDRSYRNIFRKLVFYFKRRQELRKLVKTKINNFDFIWTTTDFSAVEVGKLLLKNGKHIMQLMELVEDIPEIRGFYFLKAHLEEYAKNAYSVVVPEYNRASITNVWWELNKVPYVLPNKPFDIEYEEDVADYNLTEMIDILKRERKKVILYQGAFRDDRNLSAIAETFKDSDEYVLYIMGRDNNYRKSLMREFKNIVYLGYIKPPYHRKISEYAYIGVLPYKPIKEKSVSELNALYCAPNKIYEYAEYGVPMIGSNVPGLKFPFEKYHIGECYNECSIDSIAKSIRIVAENYEEYSQNCKNFYNEVDLIKRVKEILNVE